MGTPALGLAKKTKRPKLLLGNLKIDLAKIWDVIQEYIALYCPKDCLWPEKLETALNELPDHFCRRGKKTEYALMIVKDKKGLWQICYTNFEKGIECFSDDKNYESLLTAIENCKKYLTTRNWKK